jgi:uncharacterized protein (TIGR00369 family)
MPVFQPSDPDFERRIHASYARSRAMATIGASLSHVAPGEVDIALPFRESLSQQHGYLHAGITTTIVDTACGYAALTLMPPGTAVLTIEFKVNLLAVGEGERFIARGRVLKPGRTITVANGEVIAVRRGEERLVAIMSATMMTIRDRGLSD